MTAIMLLFVAVAIGGGYFFVFRRATFDFVSAGFFGCLVYFMPGFHGLLFNPYYPDDFPIEPISAATYGVWIAALLGAILTGILYNPPPLPPPERQAAARPFTTPLADAAILALLFLSFLIALSAGGAELFSPDKNDVLSVQDRSIILFSTLSQVSLTLFLVQRRYLMAIPAALAVAFLVFIGFRAELAISALCILTWIGYRDGIRSFFRFRNLIALVGVVLFLFAYKFLYINVKLGQWDAVADTIRHPDFIAAIFLKSEPFITQSILNEVIARDFAIPVSNFLISLVSIVPLSNVLTSISADQIAFNFQDQLFPNLRYGVASNIYANFYAALGYGGILLYIVLQNAGLLAISRAMRRRDGFAKLAFALIGAFLAFYVHRNDVANSITLMNRSLYCCLALWLVTRAAAVFDPEARIAAHT